MPQRYCRKPRGKGEPGFVGIPENPEGRCQHFVSRSYVPCKRSRCALLDITFLGLAAGFVMRVEAGR